ncbi:MAG: tetratricopeptide repeat protein [Phycisphaeraceae bacterium]
MKATCSYSAGLCIVDQDGEDSPLVLSFAGGSITQICADAGVLSTVPDWEVLEQPTITELTEYGSRVYRMKRAGSMLELAFQIDDPEISIEVIEDVEDELSAISPDQLIARMLIAPLKNTHQWAGLSKTAAAQGLNAVANILDQVVSSQPLLRRFMSAWDRLPLTLFTPLHTTKGAVWEQLVDKGLNLQIINATSRDHLRRIFHQFAFSMSTPPKRAATVAIGEAIAKALYANDGMARSLEKLMLSDQEYDDGVVENDARSNHAKYVQVMSQINAITDAIAEGNDSRARRFLKQLVELQMGSHEGDSRAVKSLCNIAKQCADMFRSDFERECLYAALELAPSDEWTLAQLGDHFKRTGEYDQAIDVLSRIQGEQSAVAESTLADVYAHQGQIEKALDTYRRIPGWRNEASIRTAIADNFRRLGDHDRALELYEELEADGLASDRTAAGKAEIAKCRGRLQEAHDTYRELLRRGQEDERSRVVYHCALANVLQRMGDTKQAFEVIDQVVQDAPFAMQARVIRASLLGLFDEEEEGLASLPYRGQLTAVGEWVRHYCRGLLLLKLQRFAEARQQLLENLEAKVLAGEERALLRLAAAITYVGEGQAKRAREMLPDQLGAGDAYAQYIEMMVRYHLAVIQQQDEERLHIAEWFRNQPIEGSDVVQAIKHIDAGDYAAAIRCEINAMLRLAA